MPQSLATTQTAAWREGGRALKATKAILDTFKDEHGFFNTFDGKVYFEGDVVPIYHYDSGTAYNGTVVKLIKPGFAGLVKIKNAFTGGDIVITEHDIRITEDQIDCWVQQPIPPDPSCYIIAPEPVAWRWHFAMTEIVKSEMVRNHSNVGVDDEGDEFRMEA